MVQMEDGSFTISRKPCQQRNSVLKESCLRRYLGVEKERKHLPFCNTHAHFNVNIKMNHTICKCYSQLSWFNHSNDANSQITADSLSYTIILLGFIRGAKERTKGQRQKTVRILTDLYTVKSHMTTIWQPDVPALLRRRSTLAAIRSLTDQSQTYQFN